MILRNLHWILLSKLLYVVIVVESQNERSYDTNDWIPITPSSGEEASNKAPIGRVLNLDAPAQKFFPEEEYSQRKRRPQTQQYLRESPFKQKHVDKQRYQQPAIYEQPPPLAQGGFLEKPLLTRQQAPAVNAPNLYQQYNLPFNNSFYQSLNPGSINAELQDQFHDPNFATASVTTTPIQDENQAVQLLYVPLENLKQAQVSTEVTQNSEKIFHQVIPPRQDNQIYSQNKQHLIDDIEHDLIQQTVQAHRLQQQIHLGRPVVLQTTTTSTTTPKPTKRKPHQPPLAVYLENSSGANVDDVLSALKDAKTVAVQDAILPTSPHVFIGPSTLNLPLSYSRFPLPYINKLEGNRIERKIENLPFFVAPLSYKAPTGYSKIPLPSPHVGSIVVSNKEDSYKRSAPRPTPIYPNQISSYESTKPAYSAPEAAQNYDPNHNTYYSTTPFQNPNYLQFSVNDNANQFGVPPKAPQEQIQQPQLSVNNIPSRSQSQIPDPINSFKNSQPVSYNQGIANSNPTTLQQPVPVVSSNQYSSPQKIQQEEVNKYTFNQEQNINNYQIPTRTNQENINSYQIPVQGSVGVAQYNQPVDNSKEQFSIPQSYPNDHANSYQRNIQKNPSSVDGHTTGTPSRSTAPQYDPSPQFVSSFDNTREINITPKTTTTSRTAPEETSQYQKQNPLNLAINQYELHQINSQLLDGNAGKTTKSPYDFDTHYQYEGKPTKDFDYSSQFEVEKSKVKGKYDYSSIFDVEVDKPKYDFGSEFEHYSSTPASILRDTFEEVPTTQRASPKTRRRGKPTRQPARTTTTTANPVEKETYTVLEEFSAKPATTPHITEAVKYEEYKPPTQVEVADVPANVYRIRTTTPNIKIDHTTKQYDNVKTVIEDIPANVYNLNVNQNTQVYTNPSSQQVSSKEILQSNVGKQEEVSHPPSYVQSPLTEVSYVPQYNENPVIEPLVQNRGHKPPQSAYNFDTKQPDVPDYTGNIQDQQIRTVLVPNHLVPTTEQFNHQPPVEQFITTTTTTTTTTTEQPRTTHSTRGRGRQRGGSRFSTASATTQASVPRRNANRRRPAHAPRTTTEAPSQSAQYASREDIQKVNTRQRFRARTRTNQPSATERISSTENEVRSYKEPTSEVPVEIQTEPTSPQSYMKFEHTVEDQKVLFQPADPPVTDYPQYYNPPVTVTENPRLILQYDNTATTQSPIMDVQITHPAPVKIKKHPVATTRPYEDTQVHLQAGGVLRHNNRHDNEDAPPRQTNRVRGRARARPRVATTTTEKPVVRTTARPVIRIAPKRTTTASTTTTTQKPTAKSVAEEEFFGFIRQPNFNQIYNIQVPAATQQPVHIYQSPNQLPNTDVRVQSYQVFGNANKNPNVRVQSYQIPQNTQQVDDIRLDFNGVPNDPTTVRFVGEIRPKYRPTTQNFEDIITATDPTEPVRVETEPPRQRVRGRARAPQRKPNNEDSTYRTQQATRRSNVARSRGRGSAHYRSPENLRQREDKEADVEGGNYPPSFFQNRQVATVPVPTNPPSFQISFDAGEDDYIDQLPNPSLLRPNVLPKPENWTEATANTNNEEYAPANHIDDDVQIEGETVSPDDSKDTDEQAGKGIETTDQPMALPVISSEETATNSDEAYKEDTKAVEELFEELNKTEKPRKGKGRRRGTWKLIRQKPVDPYEAAESQSYYSVVNTFGDIVKVKNKPKYDERIESEESEGQHELYNNYNPVLEQNSETYDYESHKLLSTDRPDVQTTKYYEVHDLNAETESMATAEVFSTPLPETNATTKESSIFNSIYEMFGITEEAKEQSTTTISSTEAETLPPVTTTVVSPTFPEEITEVPTTTASSEPVEGSIDGMGEVETTSPRTQITRTFEVEPWEMKAVRTSTSTEVSHETEICYKGKCVRSTDRTVS